jgi:hypothetical protein
MKEALAVVLFILHAVPAVAQDWSGTWAGRVTLQGSPPERLELILRREGAGWNAAVKIFPEDHVVVPEVEAVKIVGSSLSFTAKAGEIVVKFSGQLQADQLEGTVATRKAGKKGPDGTFVARRSGP